MKKQYIRPTVKAIKIKRPRLICLSENGDTLYHHKRNSYEDANIDDAV